MGRGPHATDAPEHTNHGARPAPLLFDRLMKIKLDRVLFLVGVSLLVIGVGTSVVVIVAATISFLLKLLG